MKNGWSEKNHIDGFLHSKSGTALVELIVAMLLSSMFIVVVTSVTIGAWRLYHRISLREQAERISEIILTVAEDEIRYADSIEDNFVFCSSRYGDKVRFLMVVLERPGSDDYIEAPASDPYGYIAIGKDASNGNYRFLLGRQNYVGSVKANISLSEISDGVYEITVTVRQGKENLAHHTIAVQNLK